MDNCENGSAGMRMTILFLLLLTLIARKPAQAQTPFKGLENLFTIPQNYTSLFTAEPPVIDGDINDSTWGKAEWSSPFTDIEGSVKPAPALGTKVKMLWNDEYLFIAAELNEPHVWASLTKRDDVIFNDNAFEVFIDPHNTTYQYYEIEMNALNTVFDLFMPKPYRNGGSAVTTFDTPGLQSAVKIRGTLNNPSDLDKGWTIEMAIPFGSLSRSNDAHTPATGETWRINFSRVEWDTGLMDGKYIRKTGSSGKPLPEHYWVWSPQGLVNMHYPERWGYLTFAMDTTSRNPFTLPYTEKQRQYLWLVYYRQKEYFAKNGKYAGDLGLLGITDPQPVIEDKKNSLAMEASARQFYVTISDGGYKSTALDEDGRIHIVTQHVE